MFYPTVFSNETNTTHIVQNKNYCECGAKYNIYFTFTKNDLKKIKFKHYNEVTCLKCRQVLFTTINQSTPVP
jgi:hypothetical protein